jgi:hypothetical protein
MLSDDDLTDLIDLDELCEMGRMGKDSYRHQRRQGKTPPAFKIGRRLYFKRSDALTWLHTVRMIPVDVPAGVAAAGTGPGAPNPPDGGAGTTPLHAP